MKDKVKYTLAIISLFLIDRLFKILVVSYLKTTVTLIPNMLSLNYVKNIGAAFSLMEGKTPLLIIISLIAFFFLYKELITRKNRPIINLSYILILGGILGNFYDRLVLSYVIDYISVIIFNYYFPIFNFADMLIVIGVLILIYGLWKDDKDEVRNKR